jgi:hypothetical protein
VGISRKKRAAEKKKAKSELQHLYSALSDLTNRLEEQKINCIQK